MSITDEVSLFLHYKKHQTGDILTLFPLYNQDRWVEMSSSGRIIEITILEYVIEINVWANKQMTLYIFL